MNLLKIRNSKAGTETTDMWINPENISTITKAPKSLVVSMVGTEDAIVIDDFHVILRVCDILGIPCWKEFLDKGTPHW